MSFNPNCLFRTGASPSKYSAMMSSMNGVPSADLGMTVSFGSRRNSENGSVGSRCNSENAILGGSRRNSENAPIKRNSQKKDETSSLVRMGDDRASCSGLVPIENGIIDGSFVTLSGKPRTYAMRARFEKYKDEIPEEYKEEIPENIDLDEDMNSDENVRTNSDEKVCLLSLTAENLHQILSYLDHPSISRCCCVHAGIFSDLARCHEHWQYVTLQGFGVYYQDYIAALDREGKRGKEKKLGVFDAMKARMKERSLGLEKKQNSEKTVHLIGSEMDKVLTTDEQKEQAKNGMQFEAMTSLDLTPQESQHVASQHLSSQYSSTPMLSTRRNSIKKSTRPTSSLSRIPTLASSSSSLIPGTRTSSGLGATPKINKTPKTISKSNVSKLNASKSDFNGIKSNSDNISDNIATNHSSSDCTAVAVYECHEKWRLLYVYCRKVLRNVNGKKPIIRKYSNQLTKRGAKMVDSNGVLSVAPIDSISRSSTSASSSSSSFASSSASSFASSSASSSSASSSASAEIDHSSSSSGANEACNDACGRSSNSDLNPIIITSPSTRDIIRKVAPDTPDIPHPPHEDIHPPNPPPRRIKERKYHGSLELSEDGKFMIWESGRHVQFCDINNGQILHSIDVGVDLKTYFHRICCSGEMLFICLNDRAVRYDLTNLEKEPEVLPQPVKKYKYGRALELLLHKNRVILLCSNKAFLWDSHSLALIAVLHPYYPVEKDRHSGFEGNNINRNVNGIRLSGINGLNGNHGGLNGNNGLNAYDATVAFDPAQNSEDAQLARALQESMEVYNVHGGENGQSKNNVYGQFNLDSKKNGQSKLDCKPPTTSNYLDSEVERQKNPAVQYGLIDIDDDGVSLAKENIRMVHSGDQFYTNGSINGSNGFDTSTTNTRAASGLNVPNNIASAFDDIEGMGFELQWIGERIITWMRKSIAPLQVVNLNGKLLATLHQSNLVKARWLQIDVARVTWLELKCLDYFLIGGLDTSGLITLWDSNFQMLIRFYAFSGIGPSTLRIRAQEMARKQNESAALTAKKRCKFEMIKNLMNVEAELKTLEETLKEIVLGTEFEIHNAETIESVLESRRKSLKSGQQQDIERFLTLKEEQKIMQWHLLGDRFNEIGFRQDRGTTTWDVNVNAPGPVRNPERNDARVARDARYAELDAEIRNLRNLGALDGFDPDVRLLVNGAVDELVRDEEEVGHPLDLVLTQDFICAIDDSMVLSFFKLWIHPPCTEVNTKIEAGTTSLDTFLGRLDKEGLLSHSIRDGPSIGMSDGVGGHLSGMCKPELMSASGTTEAGDNHLGSGNTNEISTTRIPCRECDILNGEIVEDKDYWRKMNAHRPLNDLEENKKRDRRRNSKEIIRNKKKMIKDGIVSIQKNERERLSSIMSDANRTGIQQKSDRVMSAADYYIQNGSIDLNAQTDTGSKTDSTTVVGESTAAGESTTESNSSSSAQGQNRFEYQRLDIDDDNKPRKDKSDRECHSTREKFCKSCAQKFKFSNDGARYKKIINAFGQSKLMFKPAEFTRHRIDPDAANVPNIVEMLKSKQIQSHRLYEPRSVKKAVLEVRADIELANSFYETLAPYETVAPSHIDESKSADEILATGHIDESKSLANSFHESKNKNPLHMGSNNPLLCQEADDAWKKTDEKASDMLNDLATRTNIRGHQTNQHNILTPPDWLPTGEFWIPSYKLLEGAKLKSKKDFEDGNIPIGHTIEENTIGSYTTGPNAITGYTGTGGNTMTGNITTGGNSVVNSTKKSVFQTFHLPDNAPMKDKRNLHTLESKKLRGALGLSSSNSEGNTSIEENKLTVGSKLSQSKETTGVAGDVAGPSMIAGGVAIIDAVNQAEMLSVASGYNNHGHNPGPFTVHGLNQLNAVNDMLNGPSHPGVSDVGNLPNGCISGTENLQETPELLGESDILKQGRADHQFHGDQNIHGDECHGGERIPQNIQQVDANNRIQKEIEQDMKRPFELLKVCQDRVVSAGWEIMNRKDLILEKLQKISKIVQKLQKVTSEFVNHRCAKEASFVHSFCQEHSVAGAFLVEKLKKDGICSSDGDAVSDAKIYSEVAQLRSNNIAYQLRSSQEEMSTSADQLQLTPLQAWRDWYLQSEKIYLETLMASLRNFNTNESVLQGESQQVRTNESVLPNTTRINDLHKNAELKERVIRQLDALLADLVSRSSGEPQQIQGNPQNPLVGLSSELASERDSCVTNPEIHPGYDPIRNSNIMLPPAKSAADTFTDASHMLSMLSDGLEGKGSLTNYAANLGSGNLSGTDAQIGDGTANLLERFFRILGNSSYGQYLQHDEQGRIRLENEWKHILHYDQGQNGEQRNAHSHDGQPQNGQLQTSTCREDVARARTLAILNENRDLMQGFDVNKIGSRHRNLMECVIGEMQGFAAFETALEMQGSSLAPDGRSEPLGPDLGSSATRLATGVINTGAENIQPINLFAQDEEDGVGAYARDYREPAENSPRWRKIRQTVQETGPDGVHAFLEYNRRTNALRTNGVASNKENNFPYIHHIVENNGASSYSGTSSSHVGGSSSSSCIGGPSSSSRDIPNSVSFASKDDQNVNSTSGKKIDVGKFESNALNVSFKIHGKNTIRNGIVIKPSRKTCNSSITDNYYGYNHYHTELDDELNDDDPNGVFEDFCWYHPYSPYVRKILHVSIRCEVPDSYFAAYRNFLNISTFHKNGKESLIVYQTNTLEKKYSFPPSQHLKFEEWLAICVNEENITIYDFRPQGLSFDQYLVARPVYRKIQNPMHTMFDSTSGSTSGGY